MATLPALFGSPNGDMFYSQVTGQNLSNLAQQQDIADNQAKMQMLQTEFQQQQQDRARQQQQQAVYQQLMQRTMQNWGLGQGQGQGRGQNSALNAAAQGQGPGNAPGQLPDIASRLNDMALNAMQAGMTGDAEKYMQAASKANLQQDQARNQQMQAQYRQLQAANEKSKILIQAAQGIHDQASMDQAAQMVYATTGTPAPWAGKPYNPNLIAGIQRMGYTLHQCIQDGIAQTRAQADVANTNSEIAKRGFDEKISAARLGLEQERADRIKAAAGSKTTIGFPTKGERDSAQSLIASRYNMSDADQTANDAQLQQASVAVASIARQIQKANPGINAYQAQMQAFEQMRPNLNFTPGQTHWLGSDDPAKFKFDEEIGAGQPKTGSQAAPQASPQKQDGKTAATAIVTHSVPRNPVVGVYYTSPRGVLQYRADGKFHGVNG
jgi:hypothetical protein